MPTPITRISRAYKRREEERVLRAVRLQKDGGRHHDVFRVALFFSPARNPILLGWSLLSWMQAPPMYYVQRRGETYRGPHTLYLSIVRFLYSPFVPCFFLEDAIRLFTPLSFLLSLIDWRRRALYSCVFYAKKETFFRASQKIFEMAMSKKVGKQKCLLETFNGRVNPFTTCTA